MINWAALGSVTAVTLVATIVVVSFMALAAKLLDDGHARQLDGRHWALRLVGAYALFGVVGLMILYGLWLIIPYLH